MEIALIGIGLVGGFVIWKYVLQPRMNEGKPIEPPEDYKTVGEQIEDAVKTATDTTDVNFENDNIQI